MFFRATMSCCNTDGGSGLMAKRKHCESRAAVRETFCFFGLLVWASLTDGCSSNTCSSTNCGKNWFNKWYSSTKPEVSPCADKRFADPSRSKYCSRNVAANWARIDFASATSFGICCSQNTREIWTPSPCAKSNGSLLLLPVVGVCESPEAASVVLSASACPSPTETAFNLSSTSSIVVASTSFAFDEDMVVLVAGV